MKLQASNSDRFLNCPGSMHLDNQGFYYNPYINVANTGSIIHEAGEKGIVQYVKTGKTDSPDKLLKTAGIDKKHPDFLKGKNAVKGYISFFKAEYKESIKKNKKTLPYIEQKYRLDINGVDCVAKMDSMLIEEYKDRISIKIFDLKTGNYDYSTSAYSQLHFTALLVIGNLYKEDTREIYIKPAVIQPNYENRPFVKMENIYYYDACQALYELESIVKTIEENKTIFTPGNHCTFCPGLLTCPSVNSLMALIITAGNSQIEFSKEFLETVFLNKSLIEKFLTAAEESIKSKIQAGESFTNVGIATGYGHRRWIDKKDVMKKLKYLGDKLYKPRELLSPAQVEKLAGKENIKELYITPEYPKLAVKKSEFGQV